MIVVPGLPPRCATAGVSFRTGGNDRRRGIVRAPLAGDGFSYPRGLAGGFDDTASGSRLFYAASTLICVPTSLSQEVGSALGAQAGEARLREVITAGGFTKMRRATETPFNMILEALP
jgi:hypothetical protein